MLPRIREGNKNTTFDIYFRFIFAVTPRTNVPYPSFVCCLKDMNFFSGQAINYYILKNYQRKIIVYLSFLVLSAMRDRVLITDWLRSFSFFFLLKMPEARQYRLVPLTQYCWLAVIYYTDIKHLLKCRTFRREKKRFSKNCFIKKVTTPGTKLLQGIRYIVI